MAAKLLIEFAPGGSLRHAQDRGPDRRGPSNSAGAWGFRPGDAPRSEEDITGLAVASDERIEAYLLYVERGGGETEILSLRSFVEDGGARLTQLLAQVRERGMTTVWFPKVHPAEIKKESLKTLGFRPVGGHLLYAAKARSD